MPPSALEPAQVLHFATNSGLGVETTNQVGGMITHREFVVKQLNRCRANLAHTRHSAPDSGTQEKILVLDSK